MQISTPLTVAGQQWFRSAGRGERECGASPFSLVDPPEGTTQPHLFICQKATSSHAKRSVGRYVVEPEGEVKRFVEDPPPPKYNEGTPKGMPSLLLGFE